MKRKRVALLVFHLLVFIGAPVHADKVYLAAAASMTDVIKEILTVYAGKQPGTRVFPNFASSGSLAKQIDQGAPADVYISANSEWMGFLKKEEAVVTSTISVLAYNSLVFVGGEALKITGMEQLDNLQRIAIGTPQNVPAGHYAKVAMENAGVYATLIEKRKLVFAKDVRQALLYADRGEADGAFVYKTDARLARNAKELFEIPATLYPRIEYPYALTVRGERKKAALDFHAFMSSETVKEILRKYGFEPVD